MIELLLLQALAHRAHGNSSAALTWLTRALALARPEGYVRVFVDEGTPMAHLVYEALVQGVEPKYTRQLLAAFPLIEAGHTTSPPTQAHKTKRVESLTERELDVLQLIAAGLSNQAIADQLYGPLRPGSEAFQTISVRCPAGWQVFVRRVNGCFCDLPPGSGIESGCTRKATQVNHGKYKQEVVVTAPAAWLGWRP